MFINFYTFFIFYFFIICSVFGYGFLISDTFGKSFSSKNIGYIGLTAIFFFTIYSYFTSLFIKHGLYHNLIFLGLGFIFFIFKIKNFSKLSKSNLFFTVGIFAFLFFGLFIHKAHDDFLYYHFQYSYYLTQQPTVIGIGNFGLGLRTSSSLFYLNSLFYLPIIKYFTFQITPVLILGLSNLILIVKINNDLKNNRYNFLTIYNLLVFIFINIFFYRISEHGTDKSAQILILILISEILLMLNHKVIIGKSITKLFILIGLIIAFKAFYILYGLLFFVIIYHLFKLKKNLLNVLKVLIRNYFVLLFIFLLILLLFHNFLISGCLIYPVSISCFDNNLWAIKINEVKDLNNWYEQWAKGGAGPDFRVDNPTLYIKNFNWVSNWIDVYFFNKVTDFLLGLSILLLVTFLTLKSSVKKLTKKKNNINLLVFFIFILLLEWFYNHPALRYGGYCLIVSLVFIYFSIYMEKFQNNINLISKKFYFLIFVTIIIFVFRNYERVKFEIEFY
ncbi:hypothetical protein OA967_00730, partial [Candidatus Pelagibacter sp.]|nr:hypothetical protein [Candidatus Pelagibacter sp.]